MQSQWPAETPMTQDDRLQIETDAIAHVRGKAKTIRSSWVAGVGPQPRKKDSIHTLVAEAQSSQLESDRLRHEIATLKAEMAEERRAAAAREEAREQVAAARDQATSRQLDQMTEFLRGSFPEQWAALHGGSASTSQRTQPDDNPTLDLRGD